jgi:hypothetical protein
MMIMPSVPNIQPDPLLPEYFWNQAAGRYASRETGRFVPQQTIRLELDNVMDNITDSMVSLSRQFRSGAIDGRAFQVESMRLIKQVHLTSAAMEKGGWSQLTSADFGRVGQIIRSEYAYFNNLISEIESGKQRLDGSLDVRMRLYGQAGRDTYHVFETESRFEQGYDEEARVLNGRDNCKNSKTRPGCTEEAAKKWVKIGTGTPIGSCTCLSFCRCGKIYRNSKTGEIV